MNLEMKGGQDNLGIKFHLILNSITIPKPIARAAFRGHSHGETYLINKIFTAVTNGARLDMSYKETRREE